MDKKTNRIKSVLFIVIFLLLAVWAGVLCFYHLAEAGIQNWDEARHIVNAYEMMSSGDGWIHTYRYETDYFNFKPPLSMWCIVLCFRIFGINAFAMRLYSAVATFFLFVLLNLYVAKKFGHREAIISAMVFLSGTDLFFWHMARSADADALYLLLFTAAMLCLHQTEKNPWFLTGFGFFLSMAFLAKCLHIAIGIAVFVFYLPRIYRKLKLKHYFGALIAAFPTGIWMIARFSYDGFAFFSGMFGREVVDRVEKETDYFAYLQYYMKNPVICLALAAVLAAILFLLISGKKRTNEIKTARGWIQRIIEHDLYLFVLWFFIPFAVYSASGAFMRWYSYVCYLPFSVIVGVLVGRAGKLGGKWGRISIILFLLPVIGFGISVDDSLWNLKTLNSVRNTDIRRDIASLVEKYPEYRGAKTYIENSRNEYRPQNTWEQSCIADAYITGDLEPLDGGVSLFIEDKEAILIISKDLFETYSSVLAGRIILVDGDDYLIFNNEFYG